MPRLETCRGASSARNARMIWSRSASSQRKHPGLRCERPSQEKLRSSQSEVRGWGMSPSLPPARSPCSNNNPTCRVLTDVALRVDDALACDGPGAGWAMLWGVKADWCCHYWHQGLTGGLWLCLRGPGEFDQWSCNGVWISLCGKPRQAEMQRGVRGWFDGEDQQIRLKKKSRMLHNGPLLNWETSACQKTLCSFSYCHFVPIDLFFPPLMFNVILQKHSETQRFELLYWN